MCDVDRFKALNDGLRHDGGNRCLVKVAHFSRSNLRENHDQRHANKTKAWSSSG